jgi:beta-glucosidase
VVLLSGRAMIVTEELDQADAFVAAFLPGTEGGGVADVLFGDYKPTGKLPVSWPRTMAAGSDQRRRRHLRPALQVRYGLTY